VFVHAALAHPHDLYQLGQKVAAALPTPNPTPAPAPARKPEPVTYHPLPGPRLTQAKRTTKRPTATTKPSTAAKKSNHKQLSAPVPAKTAKARAVSPVDAGMVSDVDNADDAGRREDAASVCRCS
jgi:hypothetical protein